MHNTLILDGQQRSALAATRSLGQKGIKVLVGESTSRSLAGSSKYCSTNIVLPDPETSPELYINTLSSTISEHNIDLLFPMTDITTATILSAKDCFKDVLIPLPSLDSYKNVSNKSLLFKQAEKLGIPTPNTVYINTARQLTDAIPTLQYPIIIKPSFSKILIDNQWVTTQVSIAKSELELVATINKHTWLQDHSYMLQEFIHGEGSGVFALYSNGEPLVFFAHRRLREKPPRGGVSVLSESIAINPRMREIAEKLLGHANWHGVAMVEFKVTAAGTPYLMEINGRFWGSLQLAIDSGVDFPYLTYLMACNKEISPPSKHAINARNRWLLGDLDRLYLVLKDKSGDYTAQQKINNLLEFIKFFSKNTRYEINRLNDLKPFLFELRKYVNDLKSSPRE